MRWRAAAKIVDKFAIPFVYGLLGWGKAVENAGKKLNSETTKRRAAFLSSFPHP
jgi:hypothetical protein